jgi:hypothetical protein
MATKKAVKSSTKSKTAKSSYSNKYGKRSMWQWVAIYVVLGIIVYGVVYFLIIGNKSGYNYNSPQPTGPQNYQYNSK